MDCLCQCCHRLFKRFIGTSMRKEGFKFGMRLFVSWLNACPFYVVNFEMMEWMENKMDVFLWKLIFNSILILTLISYYTASLRKPKAIPAVSSTSSSLFTLVYI